MNTSFNKPSGQISSEAQPFIYRDTKSGVAIPMADEAALREAQHANSAQSDNVPRISEEEISRLVSEARAEGMTEGVRHAELRSADELAKERERIAKAVADFQLQCNEYFSKVELDLVHLALAIAAKILHRESQVDRLVVAGLVKVMLERFQQKTNVVVRVRPEDEEGWRQYFRDHSGLQVIADADIPPKGCLLETELGVADMGFDAQLKEVEQGFFDLLAKKPEAR